MKINDIKKKLKKLSAVKFILPNGKIVPKHFHITEIGLIKKKFIDCGGLEREETVVNLQLWTANDFNHRLAPKKFLDIIELYQEKLGFNDLEVEVEYQTETIGKFKLDFNGGAFLLINTMTDCLDKDKCGISITPLSDKSSCASNSDCC